MSIDATAEPIPTATTDRPGLTCREIAKLLNDSGDLPGRIESGQISYFFRSRAVAPASRVSHVCLYSPTQVPRVRDWFRNNAQTRGEIVRPSKRRRARADVHH